MDHKSARPVPSRRIDVRVERTRSALRKAMLALLKEKPFEEISVRDISARAGTGYATFFRHYAERRALLNDLVSDEIAELIGLAMPILRTTNARATAEALCRYVDRHRPLWSALLTGESAGTMREEFIRQARQLPPIAPNNDSWLPDDLKIVYGVSGLFEVLAWWLQQRRDFAVDQVAEIIDRLVITPMIP